MAHLIGAAAELARQKYGGPVMETQENPTLGTAITSLVGGDPERVSILIMNLSANQVYLGFRPDVSAANGIHLVDNGGFAVFEANDDGLLPTREIFGIATGAASQLFILQLRREFITVD